MAETIDTLTAKMEANTLAASTLQATVDTLQENAGVAFGALATQIDDLKAQLAAGTPVSQEQLNALGATIDAQAAVLQNITTDVADTPIPEVGAPAPVVE